MGLGACLSQTRIDSILRNPIIALLIGIAALFLVIVGLKLGKNPIEKFNAENFAKAVVAQNPRVFERLAEM